MKSIYLIIILVFTVGSGLFFDANAEERNCKPELTCFVYGDFLEYSTYEDGKLVWKTTYEYAGSIDQNKIFVQKTDEDFDENFSFLIDGKETDIATTGIDAYLSSGISAQILYGYNYYVIQPSPVNIDKWLNHPTSAESWKGKVTEGNFIFKDKTRSVIIVKGYEFNQIIDKQTGILLLIEYTGPVYGSYFEELTSTNIIDNNSGEKIILEPTELIKNQKVPEWIKNNAGWWSDGQIDDPTFVSGIQFLIKENIIQVEKNAEKSDNQAQNIPDWVKNNAKWWSQGLITEDDFLKGIQFLATTGIINVSENTCSGTARCISGIVTEVIDGDTIKVDGKSIRFALSSAPELDEFNGDKAKNLIESICGVGSKILVDEDDKQTQGSYGRIIGLIQCNEVILNEELVKSGLGVVSKEFCNTSEFYMLSWAQKYGCEPTKTSSSPVVTTKSNCDPSYPTVCIPPYPPDLNCKNIQYKKFSVATRSTWI